MQIELLGADGQQAEHAVPINEFLRFGEKRLDLQELVDRMFDED